MVGFDDDRDAVGVQDSLKLFGYLRGQALLDLQAAGEHVHDPRNC